MDPTSYDDILRRYERCRSQLQDSLNRKIAELAGAHVSTLLADVDEAAGFLRSHLPRLRRAAIHALAFHWCVSPATDYAAAILDLAKNDGDAQVRREALAALGVVFRETDDVQVRCLLARRVMDVAETPEIRRDAYIGLCFLRAAFKESFAVRTSPEGVDWSFVQRFLDGSRPPEPVDPIDTFAGLLPCPVAEEQIELLKKRKRQEGTS